MPFEEKYMDRAQVDKVKEEIRELVRRVRNRLEFLEQDIRWDGGTPRCLTGSDGASFEELMLEIKQKLRSIYRGR